MQISGTKLFVNALLSEGVDTIFGYPGGYITDLLDELYKQDDIEVILPRHEQGLIHAADGYARSTGKVGVCLVTSGPGATNLVTGIATANYDSIPLVCFTGQVSTGLIGNDAFQEVDIIGITRGICKYGVTVKNREDLGRIIKEAFYIARSGKPGPVVIDLPKDIQLAKGSPDLPKKIEIRGYKPNTNAHVGQLKRAWRTLKNAKKPLILAGGGINISGANFALQRFAEITNIPVITTVMGRGAIPTAHPLFVGNVGMHGCYAGNKAISESDVLFSIGTRFNDRITGDLNEFAPNATIIHIDIDSSAISRNVKVDIPIVSDAKNALDKINEWCTKVGKQEWLDRINNWHEEVPLEMRRDKGLSPQMIMEKINEMFEEYIAVLDVGQHQMWATQYLEINEKRMMLQSGGLGTMGYGFPASIGAKLGNPDKTVICISGDGGFQMNLQEMATAVLNETPVIICILNNSFLGMVRQFQQLFYGKRYEITCLRRRKSCPDKCKGPNKECAQYSPDFVKLAESYGAHGLRVTDASEIEGAFNEARSYKDAPTIIEFIIDTDELVMPMVKGGNPISEMILSPKGI
ncbi:acetolactate synthase, large subunit [Acetitomaculum ruminis DSM 5522]|uniref:Acetolactate synthase n=1 Tax=Acetitomaculum ruminis DSM 5522 TaxID=1120918 RepID=A0A1I0VTH0_9FIRM|nr:biosynthetic-type acetolactate synthase large subunit [Acetitomaculum ruminis]SFA78986.1 acetolactate synthase, large subunit [Acetitomaculum ruminis DSM 5522]